MRKILFLLLSVGVFNSCEQEIDLDLDDKSGDIVIEGNVTDRPGPYYVKITKSVAFNQQNDYTAITDALVIISDNTGQIDTLQYQPDGRYATTHLVTAIGNTYTLKVFAEGAEFIAQSTMPDSVTLEGFTQDSFSIGGETNYNLLPIFTDPQTLGNRYLFIISVNGRTDKTFQVTSDNINNGMLNQRTLMLPMEDEDKVKVGDTIHVEMQCIDQNIYTYYNALLQISGNGGPGGGVTPANPPSNISSGALGYFSAHSVQSGSHIIK